MVPLWLSVVEGSRLRRVCCVIRLCRLSSTVMGMLLFLVHESDAKKCVLVWCNRSMMLWWYITVNCNNPKKHPSLRRWPSSVWYHHHTTIAYITHIRYHHTNHLSTENDTAISPQAYDEPLLPPPSDLAAASTRRFSVTLALQRSSLCRGPKHLAPLSSGKGCTHRHTICPWHGNTNRWKRMRGTTGQGFTVEGRLCPANLPETPSFCCPPESSPWTRNRAAWSTHFKWVHCRPPFEALL